MRERAREREREKVCVCVCVRERDREKDKRMLAVDQTLQRPCLPVADARGSVCVRERERERDREGQRGRQTNTLILTLKFVNLFLLLI